MRALSSGVGNLINHHHLQALHVFGTARTPVRARRYASRCNAWLEEKRAGGDRAQGSPDMTPPPKCVVFSDIDGTIMHDPTEENGGPDHLVSPPSTSGRAGAISARTIEQVAELRAQGALFVIITGARLSTLLMRLPYLPAADAFVCENGGRIFYPGSSLPTACPITEDLEWRAIQAAAGAGPVQQDAVPPARRQGVLWEWYKQLQEQGWVLDANGYTTSFRIHAKGDKTLDMLEQVIQKAPPELACSFNLGAADFYPSTSGKCEAARYLLKHYDALAAESAFLCDDDNDMALAAILGKVFLPSISSDSVRRAVAERPDHFVTPTKTGTAATEEMLEAVALWAAARRAPKAL